MKEGERRIIWRRRTGREEDIESDRSERKEREREITLHLDMHVSEWSFFEVALHCLTEDLSKRGSEMRETFHDFGVKIPQNDKYLHEKYLLLFEIMKSI